MDEAVSGSDVPDTARLSADIPGLERTKKMRGPYLIPLIVGMV